MTSVVTVLCFLPCFFIAPIAGMIPVYATAPVLTIVLIPLFFSFTQGLLLGFVSHVFLFAAVGRARELKPAMWATGALSIGLLALESFF